MSQSKIKLSKQAYFDDNLDANTKKITNLGTPTLDADAATKAYVDSVASGLDVKPSCILATAAVLPACTASGTGVGKTLTADAVGILTVDGVATVLGDRILVKNQVAGADNGIYTVTTEGTAGVAFVLTRATDVDSNAEVTAGLFSFISKGTANGNKGFVLTTDDPITVDTTALVFSQFSETGAGATTFLNLTDTPADYTGDSIKIVRVNVGETALEFATLNQDLVPDGTTNKAYTATEQTKLAGIEAAADVTDAGNVGSSIHGATAKASLVDGDKIAIIDSEASNVLKTSLWSVIKSTLKTYFDTLYLTSAGRVVREVPSGTKNGSNVTFALANTPVSGTEMIFLNGMLMNAGATEDYTIATVTITFAVAPISTDVILSTYWK